MSRKSQATLNALVMFHYVVAQDGKVRWFESKAGAERWINTHKIEGGVYVSAHNRTDALKRAGEERAA